MSESDIINAFYVLTEKAKNYDSVKRNLESISVALKKELADHAITRRALKVFETHNRSLIRQLKMYESISDMAICPDCGGFGNIEYEIETEFGPQCQVDPCRMCAESGMVPKGSIVEKQNPVIKFEEPVKYDEENHELPF